MMKKSLLAFATIALTTGAWGETVQHLGVTYTLTSASGTYTNPETSTDNRVLNTAGAVGGELTYSGILYQDSTATVEQGVNATALYLATPTFEAWSETSTSTVNKRQNGTWTPGEDVYVSTMQRLIDEGEPLLSYENIPSSTAKIGEIWLTNTSVEEDWVEIEQDELPSGVTSEDFDWDEDEELYIYETQDGVLYALDEEDSYYIWVSNTTTTYSNIGKKKSDIATKYSGSGLYTDLYFYQVGKKFYAIEKTSIDVTTIVNTTTTTNYTPTTIPSGLDWSDVTSFTIGATISTIAENAFMNSSAANINYININANNTTFAYENNILSDGYKKYIIFVTKGIDETTVELPKSYIGVLQAATYCRRNITFYWTGESFDVQGDQGQGVTFQQLGGAISLEETNDGGKKIAANSIIVDVDQLTDLITNNISTTNYLDLRTATYKFIETTYINANYENKIIIVDENSPVRGINVVYFSVSNSKFMCDEFQLSDNYSKTKTFYCPITFTAENASYDRVITEDYSSICLPFNVRYVAGNPRFMVGTLDNYNSAKNEFTFTNVKNDLVANTPYFIYATNGNAELNNLTNVIIEATPAVLNNTTINGATLCGSFTRTALNGSDDTNTFYGFSGGSLVYVAEGNVAYANGFRAYLQAPKSNHNPNVSAANIRFIIEEETAIESVKDNNVNNNEAIYNLNGQRVNEMNANGIYIKNGKKMIVK